MNGRRVVITGVGIVSALGNDFATFGERLLAGESGVRLLKREAAGRHLEMCAATVDEEVERHFTKIEQLSMDRISQMAVLAARQGIPDTPALDTTATGVYMGCGMGGAAQIQATYEALFIDKQPRVRPMTVINVMANAPAAHIALRYHLQGSNHTYSNACSSSAIAIGEAFRAIRHGYLSAAIAGGTEALLVFGSLRGWEALAALASTTSDPKKACKPFALDRTGLVLGEGAAILMLEDEQRALLRGVEIHGEVVGYASHCDASHMTQPDAVGQARTMQAALIDAGIPASAIDYINAHGTATRLGDLAETLAIKSVFGTTPPPVSSTKAAHGHTLGAAGAIEMIACLCALKAQRLPPTLNLERPDLACDLDYVPGQSRPASIGYVMSNSFAFGGSNASLVLRAYTG